MNERDYWLGLSLIPGIGPKRLAYLRQQAGSLQSVWGANARDLHALGLQRSTVDHIVGWRERLNIAQYCERLGTLGVTWLTPLDANYPRLLRNLPDGPAVLYVRGSLLPCDERALAIVGTRKASRYGREVSETLARDLAAQGVTVISGLAHGIDTAAHEGALNGGGRTLAVLGCGIDIVYPSNQQPLAQRIQEQGALLSEFPLGTPPEGRNFPRRNRLISGLALGVLVAEAPKNSGALITAGIAAEQGREVFAVPGNIFSAGSWGPHSLLQDGAKLVSDVTDILDELDIAHELAQTRQTTEQIAPASPTETQLLEHLDSEPLHIDELVRLSGLPTATVTSTLTVLELKGLVQRDGGMQYSRAHQP